MGMIIVIGIIIAIVYVDKKYVRAIDIGQGDSHQLETPTQAKSMYENCMKLSFVKVDI